MLVAGSTAFSFPLRSALLRSTGFDTGSAMLNTLVRLRGTDSSGLEDENNPSLRVLEKLFARRTFDEDAARVKRPPLL